MLGGFRNSLYDLEESFLDLIEKVEWPIKDKLERQRLSDLPKKK